MKHTERYWNAIIQKDEEIRKGEEEVKILKTKSEADNKKEENKDHENLNEIVTLATGKNAGHTRETPQVPLTQKKTQNHCALSNMSSGNLCYFQCNSKDDLTRHIQEAHTTFPCADRH